MGYTNEAVPLGQWLERLGARTSTPSGGSAAAVVLAAAAALASMAASFSDFTGPAGDGPDGGAGPRDAETIRRLATSVRGRALALASADELAVHNLLSGPSASAQQEAAAVPLEVVRLTAELAPAFPRLLQEGNERLRGDALVGAELARSAASAAGALVRIDAERLEEHERTELLALLAKAEAQVRTSLAE